MLRLVIFLSLVSLFFNACTKLDNNYSTIPLVKFNSLYYADTILNSSIENQDPEIKNLIRLNFDVKDGDGDLGQDLGQDSGSDTVTTSIDLYITIYGKKKGKWIKDNSQSNYTVPNISPTGQNKSIYATVDVESLYWVSKNNGRQLPYDTIKCTFYIQDRAKNKSNIDSSGAIVIKNKYKN